MRSTCRRSPTRAILWRSWRRARISGFPSGLEKKTLDGYDVLVDKSNGYMIFLDGLTNEVSESIIKSQYPSIESKYKENIAAQSGTYIGGSEYTLNGRVYFGISYYI